MGHFIKYMSKEQLRNEDAKCIYSYCDLLSKKKAELTGKDRETIFTQMVQNYGYRQKKDNIKLEVLTPPPTPNGMSTSSKLLTAGLLLVVGAAAWRYVK